MKKITDYGKREKIVFLVVGIFFFIYSLTYIFTFGWAIVTSLRDKLDFIRNPFAIPKYFDLSNYAKAFSTLSINGNNLFVLLLNSLWFSIGSSLISTLTANATAYCVSKYKFIGRKLFYNIAIFVMLIPIIGSLPAVYDLLGTLQMLDTPLYLVIYASGLGFNFLLFYGYYNNISWDYVEAVFIDGGGHFTAYFKMMLPQSIPMCVALGIVQFIGAWNDFSTTLLFIPEYPTLASGLYLFQFIPSIRSNYPLYYASIIIATVPVVLLYSFFQETIMKNTVAGGLKG